MANDTGESSMTGLMKGKVALVTGGASGIGKAVVAKFVQQGARVALADLQHDLGQTVAAEFPEDSVFFIKCDVSVEKDVADAVQAAGDRFGQLDVVVNNAGVVGPLGTIDSVDPADFLAVLKVNLVGPLLGIKYAARYMRAQGTKGTIVNMSSVAGIQAVHGPVSYSASKWGVVGLTQRAACELAPFGIRVNAVAPTGVETAMTRTLLTGAVDQSPPDAVWDDFHLLKGCPRASADDVAKTILYLASDLSSSVTGQTITVDQGRTIGVTGRDAPMSEMVTPMIREAGRMGPDGEQGSFKGLLWYAQQAAGAGDAAQQDG